MRLFHVAKYSIVLLLGIGAMQLLAEPPLRVDNATTISELARDHAPSRFTLSIAVFSDQNEVVTVTQVFDTTRLNLVAMQSSLGGTFTPSAGQVVWMGSMTQGQPESLYLTFDVLPNAPAGIVNLTSIARGASGSFSADTTPVRVCCVIWPPAHVTPKPLYLAVIRR